MSNKNPSVKWAPGTSGNPSGRPSKPKTIERRKIAADVKQLAREHTVDAVATLVSVMHDPRAPHSARVAAASAILDRGWGKPTVHVDENISVFEAMSRDELRDYVLREAKELCRQFDAVVN